MRIPAQPCDDYCTSSSDAAIISEDWLDHCDRMEEAPTKPKPEDGADE